jgi:phage terminase large subunit-like protein
VTSALAEPITAGLYKKNETEHTIEVPGGLQRIKAKTCWSADTLRGDYADLLILDEWQLMAEDTWELVGAPMMLDTDGDAIFIYTPPSMTTQFASKAKDPRHASKLFKKAAADTTGRWRAVHFTSHDNPYLSQAALDSITEDMTALAIRQEIMAEDLDDAPNALWTRDLLRTNRVNTHPDLHRVVVAIDPPADSAARGSGAGIMVGGLDGHGEGYLLYDGSLNNATPAVWGQAAVDLYREYDADRIVAEDNNGGEMVEYVISSIDANVPVHRVHASRGKAVRAEPVAARYEKGKVHHVGDDFEVLEDELCLWVPGDPSPHRLDAAVWLFTELMLGGPVYECGGTRYV